MKNFRTRRQKPITPEKLRSPSFKIYGNLASLVYSQHEEGVIAWLNSNGFSRLTICPLCRVDDFAHVEGCLVGEGMRHMAKFLVEQVGLNSIIQTEVETFKKGLRDSGKI